MVVLGKDNGPCAILMQMHLIIIGRPISVCEFEVYNGRLGGCIRSLRVNL